MFEPYPITETVVITKNNSSFNSYLLSCVNSFNTITPLVKKRIELANDRIISNTSELSKYYIKGYNFLNQSISIIKIID